MNMFTISSDDFLNFSTIEFQDPYIVEPDLSAGVRHLVNCVHEFEKLCTLTSLLCCRFS